METTKNINLKLTEPHEINETKLSNSFKANKENFREKLKILTSFELKLKLSHCNY